MSISESLKQKIPDRLKPPLRLAMRITSRLKSSPNRKPFESTKSMGINDYEEWYYNRPQAKEYLSNEKIWINLVDMIQYFNPNKVFEFGSGLGNVLRECQRRGVNIVGSETSEYAIRNSLCKERCIKIGEIPQNRLPFRDDSFDLIFSSEVMEHVKEEYTEAIIKELNRICSFYALLTINTFDHEQPGHINMHSRRWWLKKFERNGFRHEAGIWKSLNKMKYLQWDIYVFKKIIL